MAIEYDPVLFAARDLDALVRLGCDLILRCPDRSTRVAKLVSEMKGLLRAESGCVFESRGEGVGVMREAYRDAWRDWQSDALSSELTGRPILEINQGPINMTWHEPGVTNRARAHHVLVSCLPAGLKYLITMAFSRRAQPFNEREVALLQAVHRSELITFISPMRMPSAPDLTKRMRQIVSRLMEGDSEKQIAHHLSLSRHTVHQHIKNLYRRYDVNSRGELLGLAVDPIAKQRLTL
jgi:DNA-binding CsgD family transcriptional regulator